MRALKTPVAYFFEGYETTEGGDGFVASLYEQSVNQFLGTSEGIEMAEAFPRILSSKHRRRILELVRALAEDDVSAA